MYRFLLLLLCGLFAFSCNTYTGTVETHHMPGQVDTVFKLLPKPPGSFNDTLIINFKAAVFYHPDSLQLKKIKAQTDSMVFDGIMHEFFYQMRNARMVMKNTWPDIKILEAENYRYLCFVKKDNTIEVIDLNTKKDAYGLYVFNSIKLPQLIDMMNIETEVSFYLK